jgi:hypothetical protein
MATQIQSRGLQTLRHARQTPFTFSGEGFDGYYEAQEIFVSGQGLFPAHILSSVQWASAGPSYNEPCAPDLSDNSSDTTDLAGEVLEWPEYVIESISDTAFELPKLPEISGVSPCSYHAIDSCDRIIDYFPLPADDEGASSMSRPSNDCPLSPAATEVYAVESDQSSSNGRDCVPNRAQPTMTRSASVKKAKVKRSRKGIRRVRTLLSARCLRFTDIALSK